MMLAVKCTGFSTGSASNQHHQGNKKEHHGKRNAGVEAFHMSLSKQTKPRYPRQHGLSFSSLGNPAVSFETRGFPSPDHSGFGVFIDRCNFLLLSVILPERRLNVKFSTPRRG